MLDGAEVKKKIKFRVFWYKQTERKRFGPEKWYQKHIGWRFRVLVSRIHYIRFGNEMYKFIKIHLRHSVGVYCEIWNVQIAKEPFWCFCDKTKIINIFIATFEKMNKIFLKKKKSKRNNCSRCTNREFETFLYPILIHVENK